MTDTNYTDVTFLLDRSGSMSATRNATLDGFNEFLQTLKRDAKGKVSITFARFDDVYELVRSAPLEAFTNLTSDEFQPRGMTRLHDAIGKTIVDLGARLAAMPDGLRPAKVQVVILTDGGENDSREYRDKVRAMIEEQKAKYSWDFVFVGANQDAIATGSSLGIAASKSMSYAQNAGGTRAVFSSLASYTVNTANAAGAAAVMSNSFTAEDRKKQEEAGLTP